MIYKDFTDFLNEKFFKEHPMTLDDEWPDLYSDWLTDLPVDDLVRFADEFVGIQVGNAVAKVESNKF